MAKITIETDDIAEARSLLDALEARSAPPPPFKPAGRAITDSPETREPEPEPEEQTTGGDADLDVHGMAWDEDLHASDRSQNKDGSWKVRKGKADEAKAAIAAHKAAGGNVTPPADLPASGGGLPGAAAAPSGGLPGAKAADMPPPISQAKLEEKIVGMMNRGNLSGEAYTALLTRHNVDLSNPTAATSTNESLRAALYADCLTIEPEA